MRILLVHASYQQRGGEDSVYEAERHLLRQHGHDIVEHHVHNDAVHELSKLTLARRTIWSKEAYAEIRDLIRHTRPSVAHFHNTMPLISPAGYYAARDNDVAVVQTLHNYRLICPGAMLFRDGQTCEKCVGKRVAWPALKHKCYRSSRASTGALATMLAVHRAKGTWTKGVDAYIALTQFARQKFIAGGLPPGRIAIKPNFLADDPGPGKRQSNAALFVGRLSEEKGVRTMLDALDHLPADFELRIAGDGPLRELVNGTAARDSRVKVLGPCSRNQVFDHLGKAAVMLCPSTNFEGFPMTIVEAFARGLPVIASDLGGMASLIVPGHNGAHFPPGDAISLANVLTRTLASTEALSAGARSDYANMYSADRNHSILTRIYELAAEARAADLPIQLDEDLLAPQPLDVPSPRTGTQPLVGSNA